MLFYLSPLVIGVLPFFMIPMGGAWTWGSFLISIFGVAVVDLMLPPVKDTRPVGPKWFYESVLFSILPLQTALLAWALQYVAKQELSAFELTGVILSVGVVTGGLGITFAHELVHRKSQWQKLAGEYLLVTVCYGQFSSAHVLGHHKNVATPVDPATSRRGQSLYAFLWQAILGVSREAYQLKPMKTLISNGLSLICVGLSYAVAGITGVIFFLGQSLVAAILLESVDYIEHYGLQRTETSPGKFETVKPHHSWDSTASLSGGLLINLQRHSDHHTHINKKYYELEFSQSPHKLPTGYPGLILLSLLPPLWFRIMDKKI